MKQKSRVATVTATTHKAKSSRSRKARVVSDSTIDSLTPLEERVIRMRYGLSVDNEASLKSQGGDAFGLLARLHRIEAKVMDSAVQVFGSGSGDKKQKIISALRR